jgi:hypothetical protein
VLKFINYPTRFDTRETERALKGSGIRVPRSRTTPGGCGTTGSATSTRTCSSTAAERAVRRQGGGDHRRFLRHRQGHGLKMAEAGAKTVIVARGEEELFATRDEIKAAGGKATPIPATSPT